MDESQRTAPIEIVAGANASLAAGQPIELAFDRLLMPASLVRQTFVLVNVNGTALSYPTVAYDPVARVVTLTPQADSALPNQSYRLVITSPAGPDDPNGLRAIDGATLDPKWAAPMVFPVMSSRTGVAAAPTVDFCSQISPLLSRCSGSSCHDGPIPAPASGLWLVPAIPGIARTALGRVAQGSNTGPELGGGPPGPSSLFGIDMPIIDNNGGVAGGGDPGNSWLIYKLLLAFPPDGSTGGPTATHSVAWTPLSATERATLANYIPGREMPFPPQPSAAPSANPIALTTDQLELMSTWIAQGANVPSCN